MAYNLTYQCTVNNRRGNVIKLEIYRKDFAPASVITLSNKELVSLKVTYPQGDESKYPGPIIGCQADLSIRVIESSTITAETFLTDFYDEWKVIIYCDNIKAFVGFIDPSYSPYTMKDLPIGVSLRCTDGLGLLKNIPLTTFTGASFKDSVTTLIDFVVGALAKTNLELDTRIYCSIYESSFSDRAVSILFDMFSQAKLGYRTFLKNANEFVSCYDALIKIFKEGFCLYQWQGRWVISYRPEMQATIGPTNYFTEYDFSGAAMNAAHDTLTQVNIGEDLNIHPITLDQTIDYQVPMKSVKHTYNYVVPENLINNEHLEELGANIPSLSGTGFAAYELVGWAHKKKFLAETDPITKAYIKTEVDSFNREILRYYVVQRDTTTPIDIQTLNYIRNTNRDYYVNAGDKLDISITSRSSDTHTDNYRAMGVLIFTGGDPTDDNNYWWLNNFGKFQGPTGSTNVGSFIIDGSTVDVTQWNTASFENIDIPVDGILIFKLQASVSATAHPGAIDVHFKELSVTYKTFIGGGYFPAKGDYWKTEQGRNIKNTIDEEVFVSDSIRRIHKGAFFRNDGVTGTTPTWYRFGITESRHFKELINLGSYRHNYRRYRKITGTFRGVKCYSENDAVNFYLLNFHKHFKFVDNNSSKLYTLSPPVSIDYISGRFTGTFIECFDSSLIVSGRTPERIVEILVAQLQAAFGAAGGGTSAPTFSYSDGGTGGSSWTFEIGGIIKTGDYFKLVMNIAGSGTSTLAEYTALAGDDSTDVAAALYADVPGTYQSSQSGNQFILSTPTGSSVVQTQVSSGYTLQAIVGDLLGDLKRFRIYLGASESASVLADANGQLNTPSLTQVSNTLLTSTQRLYEFEVGPDIQPGNIYSVDVTLSTSAVHAEYEVSPLIEYLDSEQNGDTHEFKYIFQ